MTRQEALGQLLGGLWHTTSHDRWSAICASGAILPEPDIPNSDRWGTSQGSELYPYVRHLGGVSLFDFEDFSPIRYEDLYPVSNWYEFVPYRDKWGHAIWIEIDRPAVTSQLIGRRELLAQWNREKAYRHRFMPDLECAHIGPLTIAHVLRALRFDESSNMTLLHSR